MRNLHKFLAGLIFTISPLISADIITNLRNGCNITAYFDPKEITVSYDPTIAPYWEEFVIENNKQMIREIPGKPLRYIVVWTKWKYIPGKLGSVSLPDGKIIQVNEYYQKLIIDVLQNRFAIARAIYVEQKDKNTNIYEHNAYPIEFEIITLNKKGSRRSPLQALREDAIALYTINLRITKKDLLAAIRDQENTKQGRFSYSDANIDITNFDIIRESGLSCSAVAKIINKSRRDILGIKIGIQDLDNDGVILGSHGDFIPNLPAGGVAKLSFNCDKQAVQIKIFNVTYK